MGTQENDEKLKRITNTIISRASLDLNLGLMDGKMGNIIFLYHYSKYTGCSIYSEFAGLLLDDVFEDIHNKLDNSFSNGLSGIGWGIEYILKKGFVEGSSYEILEDIDNLIMNYNIKRMKDETLETGLEGMFHYILHHLPITIKEEQPFDDIYYTDLDIIANNKESYKNKELHLLLSTYLDWRNGLSINYPYNRVLDKIITTNKKEDIKSSTIHLNGSSVREGFQILRTNQKIRDEESIFI